MKLDLNIESLNVFDENHLKWNWAKDYHLLNETNKKGQKLQFIKQVIAIILLIGKFFTLMKRFNFNKIKFEKKGYIRSRI